MGVDIERVKVLVATLETVAGPHFHRMAFRTPRKTFATLDECMVLGCEGFGLFRRGLKDMLAGREPAQVILHWFRGHL